MSALKEFANFITLNAASLAETYAQLLANSNVGYEAFSVNSREASARKLLKAVADACELQTSDPLINLFVDATTQTTQRWAEHITPPNPLAEVECLGQTLTPVVTNLEAGKFLWDLLLQVRSNLPVKEASGVSALSIKSSDADRDMAALVVKEALQKQQNELQLILDAVPAMIWYKDADNRILRLNKFAANSMGLSIEEIEGRSVYELNPDLAAKYHQDDLDVIETGKLKKGIIESLTTASGESRWLRTDKIPYTDEAGHTGVVVFSIDITDHIELEQQIKESLERRNQQVQTSTEVAQEIATAPALDDLFRRVVNLVQARFGYYHAHVYTLENEELIMKEGTGQAGQKMKGTGHKIALSAEKSLVARAARSGKPVLVPDVHEEPTWLPNPLLPETKSELAVPISLKDRVLGVLDVQSDSVAGLSQEDQILLAGLCGQIAVAINNRHIEAEREQTQATLLESERKYRELINDLPVGVYRNTWQEGRFVEANPAIAAMFDADSVEEFLKHNVTELYRDPADREQFSKKLHRFGFVKDEELRLKTLKGREIVASVSAVLKEDDNGQTYFEGIIEDITERKKIETELEGSSEFLNQIIDTISDPIFVKDEQHRWVILNRAMCEFMGYDREDLIGKSDYDFFPEEEADVFWEKDEQVMESGVDNINEEAFTDAAGETHTISTKKSVFTDANGRKTLVGIIRDITDMKAAQEEAQRRARFEEMTREITQKLQRAPTLEALVEIAGEELSKALDASHSVVKVGGLVQKEETDSNGQKNDPSQNGHN